jgi:phosphate transport system protein
MSHTNDHIVTSFDEELNTLKTTISLMGGLVESQLADALEAFRRRDTVLAEHCQQTDHKTDELEAQISQLALQLLALRQPMAGDLRAIVVSLKIASDLERMGDNAKSIAKRAVTLSQLPEISVVNGIARMTTLTQHLLTEMLDAYARSDLDRAMVVWRRDEEIDAMYTSIFRELLTYMMEDPRTITTCTHLLFIAKNVERFGDHITNIAESFYFQQTGEYLTDDRPKGDTSSTEIIPLDSEV